MIRSNVIDVNKTEYMSCVFGLRKKKSTERIVCKFKNTKLRIRQNIELNLCDTLKAQVITSLFNILNTKEDQNIDDDAIVGVIDFK